MTTGGAAIARQSPVPFNDLGRTPPDELAATQEAVARVIDSGWYLLGPETEAFEREFGNFVGVAACVGVANGTDALELALRAAGVGHHDEVIVVANAGGYGTVACQLVGATAVPVDIDPGTLLINPDLVGQACTKRTRAVICTHLYGSVVDVPAVRASCRAADADVVIIEDCAQAHGAELDGRCVGSLGDLATFSFYPTKNLGAFGDAGAVVTDSPALAERVRRLHQYGWSERFHAEIPFGRNSRIDEVQAAVLRVRLQLLPERNQRRRDIVELYTERLGDALEFPQRSASHVGHLCVAQHPERDRLRGLLAADSIGTAVHYPVPDHQQLAFRKCVEARSPLLFTEQAASRVMSLPCFPELTDDEVEVVCRGVLNAIEEINGR